ncbi:hypothetical protein [Bdellovibrio sp. HCB337]|uniref:hypothetical protein n=1 Tax=Bdellovibrio sp. HCB337 TaxID=3394358 RepID=UPI0039A68D7D
MKRLIPVLVVVVILAGIGAFVLGSKSPLGDDQAEDSTAAQIKHSAPIPQGPALPAPEKDSLSVSVKEMTHVLAAYAGSDNKLEDLIENLKKTNQEPYMVRDTNKYTGEMIIVRTKSPLPGTRYFHAQYFQDEDKSRFPQHMSFEFRPHAEAMDQAIAAVRESFPNLGNPEQQATDFIQWDLGNGHVLWIKRLGYEDIEENPFNAYTEADLGSIRVAVELKLEGH